MPVLEVERERSCGMAFPILLCYVEISRIEQYWLVIHVNQFCKLFASVSCFSRFFSSEDWAGPIGAFIQRLLHDMVLPM